MSFNKWCPVCNGQCECGTYGAPYREPVENRQHDEYCRECRCLLWSQVSMNRGLCEDCHADYMEAKFDDELDDDEE